MKLFLFLDDWLLDEKIDVVRRFAKAVQVPVPQAHKFARISILWDEKRKFFVGLGKKNMKKKSRDIAGAEYFFHEGKDGIKWNARSGHPEFHFPGSRARRLYVPGSFPFAGGRPIRVEFRLLDARLYAMRMNCKVWYGYWPGTEVDRI